MRLPIITIPYFFFVAVLGFSAEETASPAPKIVPGETARKVDAASLANIDLEKTPWLCESVGLSPTHPAFSRPRTIWADSFRYVPLNEITEEGKIIVERWVNEPPKDLTGKYVFVEVWATWCPPCRRSLPLLNFFHEKYKDQLVVVSICETDEKALEEMKGPLKLSEIDFHLAVDTNRRFADKLGVYGIPHAVILEPVSGAVIWEGMPTLPGYELDDKTIEKILAVGKRLKDAGKIPDRSPIRFTMEKADPNYVPKHHSQNASW